MTDTVLDRRTKTFAAPRVRNRPSAMTVVVWLLIALIALLIFYPLLTALVRVAADLATGADRVQPGDLLGSQSNVYVNMTILVLCAGALALINLSRLEMQIALEELLGLTRRFELAGRPEVQGWALHGPTRLPIALHAD